MKTDLALHLAVLERSSLGPFLVVGDLILDRYIWGDVNRISPEAPVPVVEYTSETYALGGAANVAANLAALGATVELLGVVGDDRERESFVELCRTRRIGTEGVIVDPARPTTTKTRVIGHNQQMVRIDREVRTPIGDDIVRGALHGLGSIFPRLGAVVVSDYAKGFVVEPLLDELRRLRHAQAVPVVVDPKSLQFSVYRDFTIMTPNLAEAATGAGFRIRDELSLVEAGYKLRTSLNLEAILITRGPQGMSLFEKGREVLHLPTVARNVYDVTGAGDTVASVIALGLSGGLSFRQAAHLANHAAGFVVGKFGTATVSFDELRSVVCQE